jgi:hypothetical protein
LFVNGLPYRHTAAKFWPTLIDEVRQDFPSCTMVELAAACSGLLERRHLYPELAFQRDLEDLLNKNLDEEMRNTLAALDVTGPPPAVSIRLMAGEREVLADSLPLDCVDAEIFTYLVAWPLEWGAIPIAQWNNEFLSGEFLAEDRRRRRSYTFSFSLVNRHLSEGLFKRVLSLAPLSSAMPDGGNARA